MVMVGMHINRFRFFLIHFFSSFSTCLSSISLSRWNEIVSKTNALLSFATGSSGIKF